MTSKKPKIFYDTEFHEDGNTIDLISIGMVCEDGRTYYAISSEADYGRIRENSWLMENVMTSINYEEGDYGIYPIGHSVKTRNQIRHDIVQFVGEDTPELWAWYADYDHVALCQLFGKMIDLPPNFPMFTRDLRQHWEYRGCTELPKQTSGEHNALDDALHNLIMYRHMEGI